MDWTLRVLTDHGRIMPAALERGEETESLEERPPCSWKEVILA